MSFICTISGEAPTEPVVSAKTGRVYEKRLLQKHLEENRGREPHTDHDLSEDDIIAVHADPPTAKPRPPTLTSIPALLSAFQNEWDALVLETFTLKQQYHQVRQELSHALYQNDAACRVVARLMKERDDARLALATLQAQVGTLEPAAAAAAPLSAVATAGDSNMDVDGAKDGTEGSIADSSDPATVFHARVAETAQNLRTTRMKREAPAKLTSADSWKSAKESFSVGSLHTTTKPGIVTLDLDRSGTLALTGGLDNHAEVYSRTTDNVIGTLKGHTKRITAALWAGNGGGLDQPILTASADKSVRLWVAKPANTEEGKDVRSMGWTKKYIVKHHKAEVVGLSIHPSGDYFASAAADGSWAIHAIDSGNVILSGTIDTPISQIAFHPDGIFLAIGTADGFAKIFDLKQQQTLATLDAANSTESAKEVTGLHFSENGYYFATVSSHKVAVWDLRKQKMVQSWTVADLPESDSAEDALFTAARFDWSGKYLALAAHSIHVLNVKGWQHLAVLPCADTVQAVQWVGDLSTGIVAACLENSLHIYEPAN
ncbi:hypothetical protein EV174_004658 [Coemansia sp. RSA 2320]|nr:hypothetical protein EV174_004658 [Coemansia sp. RSA 2320]